MTHVLIHKHLDKTCVTHFVRELTPDEIMSHADRIVPSGHKYTITTMDQLPGNEAFRAAWDIDDGDLDHVSGQQNEAKKHYKAKIKIDLDRAKQITHDKRRVCREQEFAPHDEIIMKQIPGVDHEQAEQARGKIRQKYKKLQNQIDSCKNVAQLQKIVSKNFNKQNNK